ncbi:MAG: ATPase, partial [Bacteroidota bacterium]
MEEQAIDKDLQKEHQAKIQKVISEVGKVVIGQEYMVNRLMVGLFTQGHVLLEGVPGLA